MRGDRSRTLYTYPRVRILVEMGDQRVDHVEAVLDVVAALLLGVDVSHSTLISAPCFGYRRADRALRRGGGIEALGRVFQDGAVGAAKRVEHRLEIRKNLDISQ